MERNGDLVFNGITSVHDAYAKVRIIRDYALMIRDQPEVQDRIVSILGLIVEDLGDIQASLQKVNRGEK